MARFVVGDIVVVPFPFSDLSNSKRRPALVLADLVGDDIILCQITSQFNRDLYTIKLHNEDFETGSLKKDSNIRPNRIFTANKKIILYKVGTINNQKFNEVIDKLNGLFKRR